MGTKPDQTERTFIMLKPDAVQRGLIADIIKRFEQKGFKLVAMKFMQARFFDFFTIDLFSFAVGSDKSVSFWDLLFLFIGRRGSSQRTLRWTQIKRFFRWLGEVHEFRPCRPNGNVSAMCMHVHHLNLVYILLEIKIYCWTYMSKCKHYCSFLMLIEFVLWSWFARRSISLWSCRVIAF